MRGGGYIIRNTTDHHPAGIHPLFALRGVFEGHVANARGRLAGPGARIVTSPGKKWETPGNLGKPLGNSA